MVSIPHPDGRPYPWLSAAAMTTEPPSAGERYLIYQPFAGMCNQFSCIECAVAVARATGRTLVLPRWRPQYGWPWLGATADYFNVSALLDVVPCITLEAFAARRVAAKPGEGVALIRLALEYNPTWSVRGFDLYPALGTLLDNLEYFREIDADDALSLGCSSRGEGTCGSICVEVEQSVRLARPLRGQRELSAQFGGVSQVVLALDHAFNIVALPSVLDAGERALLLSALRPCARLRDKLNEHMAAHMPRPCLAAHVRRTDHWRLAKLMGDDRFWPAIEVACNDLAQQPL